MASSAFKVPGAISAPDATSGVRADEPSNDRPASLAERPAASPGKDPIPLLICFSHLRWDFVWQRPQHLLSRAARHYRVVVFEEPVFRPGAVPQLEATSGQGGVTVVRPILPAGLDGPAAIAAQRHLVDALVAHEADGVPRLLWYYTPMALAFTRHLASDVAVYDNMDELSLFRGASPELVALEDELFRRVDLVFTGGMSLYEAKKGRHGNVRAYPSSIEFEHFAAARRDAFPEPADQAGIARPRLGFFGVVDERMDVGLVADLAALRPDWQFVMIGPVVKIDPASLPRRDNVHWLGSKTYAELPAYLANWDVGLMPFALNEATRFISPTKTPEFLAAGLPVVSTPIADVVRPYGQKGLVEIAATAGEVAEKIEALLRRPRRRWLTKVDRHLAQGSWDRTWSAMRRQLDGFLGTTPAPRRDSAAAAVKRAAP